MKLIHTSIFLLLLTCHAETASLEAPKQSIEALQQQEEDNETRELIVEGTLASINEFPWFVSSTGDGYCGGSLIAPSVVLTAAHCSPFTVGGTVFIGATRRSSILGGAQFRTVTRMEMHPNYVDESNDFAYDLMLMQLSSPVTTIDPIAWNDDPAVPVGGTDVTVMGFGRLSFGDGPISLDLLKVNLDIVSDSECLGLYGRNNLNTEVELCAIGSQGLKQTGSACQGDSGGPLVMDATDPETGLTYPLQVGVVSWGIRCGSNIYPGVYARPSGVVDWMETTICDLSPDCNSTAFPTQSPVVTPAPQPTPPTASGPTPAPAVPTNPPTYVDTCICLSEPQCLQALCSRVSNQRVCEALGCDWFDGVAADPPPNVEDPDDNDADDVFPVEDESALDLEKAGFALLVGLAAAIVTFCLLCLLISICCNCCRRKEPRTRRRNPPSPNRQPNYPAVKRRQTDITEDMYVFSHPGEPSNTEISYASR